MSSGFSVAGASTVSTHVIVHPTSEAMVFPLDHLRRLMGPHGLFEHARYRRPRLDHGYTTDDNGRALVVASARPEASDILEAALRMVVAGYTPDGWHNRLSASGVWLDQVGSEDAQGRAVWGLGVAAGRRLLDDDAPALEVLNGWHRRPLTAVRAIAYAMLGATAALDGPIPVAGERLILSYRPPPLGKGSWPWPEERLTYDNARIPEAMMATGIALGDTESTERGLALLEWLVGIEELDDRFAFTPVGGRGPDDPRRPGFDQQPLEAWAMADACRLALSITGDAIWLDRLTMAVEWFWGRNHAACPVFDPADGAGYDGLEAAGVNENAGAESTLAALGAHLALASLTTA